MKAREMIYSAAVASVVGTAALMMPLDAAGWGGDRDVTFRGLWESQAGRETVSLLEPGMVRQIELPERGLRRRALTGQTQRQIRERAASALREAKRRQVREVFRERLADELRTAGDALTRETVAADADAAQQEEPVAPAAGDVEASKLSDESLKTRPLEGTASPASGLGTSFSTGAGSVGQSMTRVRLGGASLDSIAVRTAAEIRRDGVTPETVNRTIEGASAGGRTGGTAGAGGKDALRTTTPGTIRPGGAISTDQPDATSGGTSSGSSGGLQTQR